MHLDNIVLGNSPVPQSTKEPKSLYQSPSGPSGAVFTHSCKRPKSSRLTYRSATRVRRCSQTGRGRLANRIFGNRLGPKNSADQILACLSFAVRIRLRQEAMIRCIEVLSSLCFGLDTPLRKLDKRPAVSSSASPWLRAEPLWPILQEGSRFDERTPSCWNGPSAYLAYC